MPCNDEINKEDDLANALEDAELALNHAERKMKNRIEASLAACTIGAATSIFGGLPGALIGGAACLTTIFAADDAAADYDFALAQAELAHDRQMRALLAAFSCLSRCGPVGS